ncbi:MAG TPA: hypothetical protein VJ997_07985 [Longimicrobiales bacterium]|nr:hypothetical protein [Longimicrobiales bacterium]
MTEPGARQGGIVADVVAAEAARAGCRGVVLASPPGPESELLAWWLPSTLPLRTLDPGAVADVAGALASAGAPGPHVEALAWQAVARAQALAHRLLPVGTTNKIVLLLEDAPLPARVLPLGDVWASDVHRWSGRATLPAVLLDAGGAEVAAVEKALRDYLEEGMAPDAAFAPLGTLGPRVRAALDAAEPHRRGLVVPKLESWTAGIDLAR